MSVSILKVGPTFTIISNRRRVQRSSVRDNEIARSKAKISEKKKSRLLGEPDDVGRRFTFRLVMVMSIPSAKQLFAHHRPQRAFIDKLMCFLSHRQHLPGC